MGVTTYNPNRPLLDMGTEILPVRVRRVILDDQTYKEDFNRLGEWASIGTIFFDSIDKPSSNPNPSTDNYATPLFPNNKIFPLENEIVYIISLPSTKVQNNFNDKIYYYFQPINIWNSVHHNAVPNPIEPPLATNQNTANDYKQTDVGYTRKVEDGSTEIELGDTFKEKLEVKNTQPFEGDVIHEGRWGQSIRLGSTVKDSKIPNPWSKDGENGDPITIIKNKQRKDDKSPWIPQVEDINKDGSSVYLTSNQSIPIEVGQNNKKYSSYTSSSPTVPEKYVGEQVIINSNRILLNSKSDHLILNANQTISLNSEKGFNFETSANCVIKVGTTIELGGKDATEPAILGEIFLSDFKILLEKLIPFLKSIDTPLGTGLEGETNPAPPLLAVQPSDAAQAIIDNIDNYKSQVVKIKR